MKPKPVKPNRKKVVLTATLTKTYKRSFPAGTVDVRDDSLDWITWAKGDMTGIVTISTCRIADFECQNDTAVITLSVEEIKNLAAAFT